MSFQKFPLTLLVFVALPAFARDPLSYWSNGQFTYQCKRMSGDQGFSQDPKLGANRINSFGKDTKSEVTIQPSDSAKVQSVKSIFMGFQAVFEKNKVTLIHFDSSQNQDFTSVGDLPQQSDDSSPLSYDLDYSVPLIQPPNWDSSMGEGPPTVTKLLFDPTSGVLPGANDMTFRVDWEEPDNDDDYILMVYDCSLQSQQSVGSEPPPASLSSEVTGQISALLADGQYQGVTHARAAIGFSPTVDGLCQVKVQTTASDFTVTMSMNETGLSPVQVFADYSIGSAINFSLLPASPQSFEVDFTQNSSTESVVYQSVNSVNKISIKSGNSAPNVCDQLQKVQSP